MLGSPFNHESGKIAYAKARNDQLYFKKMSLIAQK